MAGRATPFGLFAGCSTGTIGSETRLELPARTACSRHTRLDMDYLSELAARLGADPEVRARLRYWPNSSLYRAAGRWRYAEVRLEGRARRYHLVAAEPSEHLDATLVRAREGASAAALAAALVGGDVNPADAEAFIGELIDTQLLVPELEPSVTGPEPIHGLIETLARAAPAAATALAGARDALRGLDDQGLGAGPERYREVARGLEGLPAPVELPRLFQVDLVKPTPRAVLGAQVVAELERAIVSLHRISPAGEPPGLRRFREEFERRYETREIPLALALDEEAGLGYEPAKASAAEASPLLRGLDFGGAARDGGERWGEREAFLLGKLHGSPEELVLDDSDLAALARAPRELPDALAAVATLHAESQEALRAGDFRVHLVGVAGPSGALLLGRFCHADPGLLERVRAHLRAEEAFEPGAVFAEIVHLPEGRTGNVLHRPLLRDHELAFLGRSGAPEARRISVDDLWVSIRDGRVVLRSERLGREVVPRMSNAHDHAQPRNLGLYRFLCALQHQGSSPPAWRWGPLDAAPYLPRVRLHRTIVSPRRWRLSPDELAPVAAASGADRFRALLALRAARDLPSRLVLSDGDHELPLDLDNALCVDAFAHARRGRKGLTVRELLDGPLAFGPDGRYVHELVVPLVRTRPPGRRAPARPRPRLRSTAERRFPPGSSWLYAKLHGGVAVADDVLREAVLPLVTREGFARAVDRWFFVRYADPETHLRLRFHGEREALAGWLNPLLEAALEPHLAEGRLWRIQLDTYEREVERYGGPEGVEIAEELSCADSMAVLEFLGRIEGDPGADLRWKMALASLDLLLEDFGLDLEARHALAAAARDGFRRELGSAALDRQLGDRFRALRPELEGLLAGEADWLPAVLPPFARRSERTRPLAARLRALAAAGRLDVPLLELVPSYLHMHVNRMLRSAQRAQELVLYDLLTRLYEGRRARGRRGR